MKIGTREIGSAYEPYVIAEIGVNHDGSVTRAQELIDHASQAGADAVKLQFFETDRLLSSASKLATYQASPGIADASELLRKLELSIADMKLLAAYAVTKNLHPIVTVYSVELVQVAALIDWAALKIASTDIINRPLIQAMKATSKPIILSTGAATLAEVKRAVDWLGNYPFALLQCVSAYPTPNGSAHLAGIRILMQNFSVAVGYSDHTTSVDTGALAVATGASIIEKHITYDRNAPGPDHAASFEPDEFGEYVQDIKRAFSMLGSQTKEPDAIEHDVRNVSRQSIITKHKLDAGHILTESDLTIKRPGTGIEPYRLKEILGQQLSHALEADTLLLETDLKKPDVCDTAITAKTSQVAPT
ncbi:MAG: N-acetylneuraminate synthase family protein [Planctomycetes bacterium]|nr:N-acetylneuraminate synthase family protein [Planctomycetota bacterium]